jgi:O-antigen ligase
MWLFYLLITVMPLSRHPLWSKFVGELTIIKYLGAACVLYALIHVVSRETRLRILASAQVRLFLVLASIASLSFAMTGNRGPLIKSPIVSYLSFLVLLFLTLALIDSFERLRMVFLVTVGSVAFASLYLLREWQQNHGMYAGYRPGYVVGDSNYYSLSAVMCLPIAFYLTRAVGRQWERLFYTGSLLLILAASILAASRGGFLGMVAAGLYMGWHTRQRVRNLAVASLCMTLLFVAAPVPAIQRLMKPSYSDQVAAENRRDVWKAGARMIEAKPVLGVGLGEFKPQAPLYARGDEHPHNIAHNSYIEYAAELGIPAVLVFLGILFTTISGLRRSRACFRLLAPWLERATLGMEAGIVGFAVASFFVSSEYQKLFWFMIFLSAAIQAMAAGLESMSRRRIFEQVRRISSAKAQRIYAT